MFYGSNATTEDYRPDHNPLERAVAVLQRQFVDTVELQLHVDIARENINAGNAPNIGSLLDGMSGELTACCMLLQRRIALLSSDSARARPSETGSEFFWDLFRSDGSDCPAHLEALLSGYAHYARATCDSIAFLQLLGDAESARLLERVSAVAERSLWFIELYMEGLALHMDVGYLPEWTPTI